VSPRLATALVAGALLAGACGKPSDQAAPAPTAPPRRVDAAVPAAAGSLTIQEGAAMDLRHTDRVTAELALAPGGGETRHVQVPAGRNVILEVIQTAQATGRLTLTIHDAAHPELPVSDDAMTCAEPECRFSVEVKAADRERTLIAACTSSVVTTVRLEARMVKPPRPGG
jgi:hypothetical protein